MENICCAVKLRTCCPSYSSFLKVFVGGFHIYFGLLFLIFQGTQLYENTLGSSLKKQKTSCQRYSLNWAEVHCDSTTDETQRPTKEKWEENNGARDVPAKLWKSSEWPLTCGCRWKKQVSAWTRAAEQIKEDGWRRCTFRWWDCPISLIIRIAW